MTLEQVVAIVCGVGSLICTIVVGVLAFFMKRTLAGLEESDRKNANDIKALDQKVNDLKSDLPLVYVLREDFIRSMNSVDNSINRLGAKMDQAISLITKNRNGG